jgi:telomerase reverse transcriptase
MFSVGDIYERIRTFKRSMRGDGQRHFFFAKVDVQAAFDTIPQDAIIDLMKHIPEHSRYLLSSHFEMQPLDETPGSVMNKKAAQKWHSVAKVPNERAVFRQTVEDVYAPTKKGAIFVDNAFQRSVTTESLMALMACHIKDNLVKIGKKYYRQKKGIPQGSVLSSMLCNYFYADLEVQELPFLQTGDCLLLRLIDDFLLITTDKDKACRFVEIMHHGLPKYGVKVGPSKSLVNFDLETQGVAVPRIGDGQPFPYCGNLIDCSTLGVAKDRDNPKDPGMSHV